MVNTVRSTCNLEPETLNASQQQFELSAAGPTQCARILARLEESVNQWVSMPELARAGSGAPNGFCMVHSRVADLRKRGHTIEHRSARVAGTKVHSSYRLIRPTGPTSPIP